MCFLSQNPWCLVEGFFIFSFFHFSPPLSTSLHNFSTPSPLDWKGAGLPFWWSGQAQQKGSGGSLAVACNLCAGVLRGWVAFSWVSEGSYLVSCFPLFILVVSLFFHIFTFSHFHIFTFSHFHIFTFSHFLFTSSPFKRSDYIFSVEHQNIGKGQGGTSTIACDLNP